MSWHDLPATEDTDWCSVDFLQQFIEAHNERSIWTPTWLEFWVSANVYRYPLLFEDAAEDDDIAYVNSAVGGWSITTSNPLVPTRPKVPWTIELAQESLEFMVTRYTKPSTVPANHSNLTFPTDLTLSEWRSAASLPSGGFTRKFPREIASPAAAGTSGWRARALSDLQFYEHNGSAWVLSSDQISGADLLTANGLMQPGDYIGPWLFNELRAGLDALSTMHWFGGSFNAFFNVIQAYPTFRRTRSGSTTNQPDAATARSGALDMYEDDTLSNYSVAPAVGFEYPYHNSLWAKQLSPGWLAQLNHEDIRLGFSKPGEEVRVRVFVRYSPDAVEEFDDWGLDIVANRWSLLHDAMLEQDDHVVDLFDGGGDDADIAFSGFLTDWIGPPDLPAPDWATDEGYRGLRFTQGISATRHGSTVSTVDRLLVIEPTFEYHAD